jgi:hypothetical protein
MDRIVAEKVMGWTLVKCQVGPLGTGYGYETYCWSGNSVLINIWSPSTNIAHAWEVINRLKEDYEFRIANDQGEFLEWGVEMIDLNNNNEVSDVAETAPHAICLAALMAVGAIEVQP